MFIGLQLCSAPASGTRTPTACGTLGVADRNRARMRLLEPLPHDPRLPSVCRHDAKRLSPRSVTLGWLTKWLLEAWHAKRFDLRCAAGNIARVCLQRKCGG